MFFSSIWKPKLSPKSQPDITKQSNPGWNNRNLLGKAAKQLYFLKQTDKKKKKKSKRNTVCSLNTKDKVSSCDKGLWLTANLDFKNQCADEKLLSHLTFVCTLVGRHPQKYFPRNITPIKQCKKSLMYYCIWQGEHSRIYSLLMNYQ